MKVSLLLSAILVPLLALQSIANEGIVADSLEPNIGLFVGTMHPTEGLFTISNVKISYSTGYGIGMEAAVRFKQHGIGLNAMFYASEGESPVHIGERNFVSGTAKIYIYPVSLTYSWHLLTRSDKEFCLFLGPSVLFVRENVESLYGKPSYESPYYYDYTSISYKTQGKTIGAKMGLTYAVATKNFWGWSFGLSYLYGSYRNRDIGGLMTQIGIRL